MKYFVELPHVKSVELVSSSTDEYKTLCHVEGCESGTTATCNVFCEEHRKTHIFDISTLKGVKRNEGD
ncbi:hypothetical protein [Bacillus wiedmannii]|uniref:hypothetical protein n=1 Tax=Bacillus wiedmannii TaxID=1890302 RepID=UPI000BF580E0|nr:hypothetical protein [Bacillus wiedmannii]PGA34037.1 hypothetical protein COL74_12380 [Bacillus wiedmannii]